MNDTLSIRYTTRKGKLPRLPFLRMKDAVLGASYELSVASVGRDRMKTLNRGYRGKNYATDILSFPISKTSGEIILYLPAAYAKAKKQGVRGADYLGFLFIHGLLHLAGHGHGRIMEREEKALCARFGFRVA